MDTKAGMPPGKEPLRPLEAQQLLADKVGLDLPGEDLRQSRVVDPRDQMEDSRRIRPALSHQEMEVGMTRVD